MLRLETAFESSDGLTGEQPDLAPTDEGADAYEGFGVLLQAASTARACAASNGWEPVLARVHV